MSHNPAMPVNVEIKARIPSVETLLPVARALGDDEHPQRILQDDTFFRCPDGRLKLRAFSASEGELIFYRRADEVGPKESFYVRSPSPVPDSLREALTLAYGACGRVRKRRTLYMVGRTRVHLDDVEGLGIVPGTRVELELSGERYYAVMARTFADARPGDVILYEDSYKKMSLAISRGSAARMLHASPGHEIRITIAG